MKCALMLLLGISVAAVPLSAEAPKRITGTLQASRQVETRSNVTGKILKFVVRVGAKVRKGDVLMEIEESGTLAKGTVLASMNGVVLAFPIGVRQPVEAAREGKEATVLAVLGDTSRLIVESHVEESLLGGLVRDEALRVESGGDTMKAVISFIAPISTVSAEGKGRVVQAMIDNPGGKLQPGMKVDLEIPGR